MSRGRQRSAPSEGSPDAVLGEVLVGGEKFLVLKGLLTLHAALMAADPEVVRRAYARCRGGPLPSLRHMRQVVGGLVQNAWYTTQGKEIPMTVKEQQERREAAATADATSVKTVAASAVTVGKGPNKKREIRALMGSGQTDEQIYAALKPQFKTLIMADIRWCRAHPLRRDGL